MSTDEEDRISLLTDDLIHHILSFVPSTKSHIQTSILSKRWRHLWAHHTNLYFSIPRPKITDVNANSIAESYILSVDRSLDSFSSHSLHCFDVDLIDEVASYRWLCFAALKSVQNLTVDCRLSRTSRFYRIPRSIFLCQHVSHLALNCGRFRNLPRNFQGFHNLKNLSFLFVHVADKTLVDLLDYCPLLESLKLDRCKGPTRLDVSPKNLPNLTHLVLVPFGSTEIELSIEAPNLRTLRLEGELIKIDWKGLAAVLTEASLAVHTTFVQWMKLARAVSNVSVLNANSCFFQIADPKTFSKEFMFRNLKELNCNFNWVTSCLLIGLINCLGECPLLENLFINLDHKVRSMAVDALNTLGWEISTETLLKSVECVYEQDIGNPTNHLSELDYSLHHLKTITMKYFLGTKNEMRLAQFLLGKAFVLEKLIVHDFLKREELKLQEIFANVPQASSHVQIIFHD